MEGRKLPETLWRLWYKYGRPIQTLKGVPGPIFRRKKMNVGDLVRVKERYMPEDMYFYYQVKCFYPLIDGGEGVEFKGLGGGIISSSMPLDDVIEVKHFKNLEEMQADIDQRKQ